MQTVHLKQNQLRAHANNSDGIHTPGSWKDCPACRPCYLATMSRRERAEDAYRLPPSDLIAVRTVYNEIFYIPSAAKLQHDDGSPRNVRIYKRNGTPMLTQRNRESDYHPDMLHPRNICPHAPATWQQTAPNPDGTMHNYCPICSPSYATE